MVIANGHQLSEEFDEEEIERDQDTNDTAGLPPELIEAELEYQKRKAEALKENPNAKFAHEQIIGGITGGSEFSDKELERFWNNI